MEKTFKLYLGKVFGRLFEQRMKYLIIPPAEHIDHLTCYMTNISPEDAVRYKPSGEWDIHILRFLNHMNRGETAETSESRKMIELFFDLLKPLRRQWSYLYIGEINAKLNKYKVKELESLDFSLILDPKSAILGHYDRGAEENETIVVGTTLSAMEVQSYLQHVHFCQMTEEDRNSAYCEKLGAGTVYDGSRQKKVVMGYSSELGSIDPVWYTKIILYRGRNIVNFPGYEKLSKDIPYTVELFSWLREGTIFMCTEFHSPDVSIQSYQVEARWFPLAIKEK